LTPPSERQPLPKLEGPGKAQLGCPAHHDEPPYDAPTASENFRRPALEKGIPLLESCDRSYFATLDPGG
jgi:hypothetical protein